jgi:hypothetical protein
MKLALVNPMKNPLIPNDFVGLTVERNIVFVNSLTVVLP